jgi:hypothetical protein
LLLQYLRYMTFVVETAIKNMKNGAEQWVWMLDLAGGQQGNACRMMLAAAAVGGCWGLAGMVRSGCACSVLQR